MPRSRSEQHTIPAPVANVASSSPDVNVAVAMPSCSPVRVEAPMIRELPTARGEYARAMRGGIDLGGTKIQAVIVDSDHEVRGETRVPTPTSGGPSDVTAAMAGALGDAAKAAGVQTAELDGVGVGSPGDVDGEKGTVTSARNLPD